MEDPTRLNIIPLYGREQLNKGPLERALKDAERARFIPLKRDLKPAFYLKPGYLWAVFDHNGRVWYCQKYLEKVERGYSFAIRTIDSFIIHSGRPV
jgi:hypothetical protein